MFLKAPSVIFLRRFGCVEEWDGAVGIGNMGNRRHGGAFSKYRFSEIGEPPKLNVER